MKNNQLRGVAVPAVPLLFLFSFLVYWSLSHDRPSYLEMQQKHLSRIDSLNLELNALQLDFNHQISELDHTIDVANMKHKEKEDSLKMVIEFLEYQQKQTNRD